MSDIFETPKSNLVDEKLAVTEYGSIEKAIQGDYEFTIGAVLKEAWAKTKGSKWPIHMGFFWYFLVTIGIVLLFQLAMVTVVDVTDPNSIIGLAIVENIVIMLVLMPVNVGLLLLGVKRSVDAPLESTSVFDYFNKAGSLFLAMILIYIMIIIGYLLFVIPGIYLTFAYFMAMPLIVEKDLSPWQAMEVSRKAITKRWFSFLFLSLIIMLIFMLSMIPLGIGMIWSLPMIMVAYGILYRNMFGVEGKTRM